MSLAVVKELFEEATGRYDLTVATGYLNSVWLINKGIRWLEKRYPLKNTRANYKVDIATNAWYVRLNNCMAIYAVYRIDSEGTRTALNLRSKEYILKNYGEQFGDLTTGDPVDWCPTVNRAALATQTSTYDSYAGDLTSMNDYNGLIVLPPADETFSLLIDGDFFSEDLSEDSDENFWTSNCPMAVALAASLQLDKIYRNKEGVAASRDSIYDDIQGDLANVVWEEAVNANQGLG